MTYDNKQVLIKRLKSLGWRSAMMVGGFLCVELIDMLPLFDLPTTVNVIVGLVLGEVSKMLNTK